MNSDIPPSDRWGPFRPDLSLIEYVARLRTLKAVAHCLCGKRADALCAALTAAEDEPGRIGDALALFNRLPSLDARRVVAAFGWLSCPAWRS